MDGDADGDQQDEKSQGEEAVDVAHVFFCGARAVRARKPCGKSELKVFDRSKEIAISRISEKPESEIELHT
jgi:hypothetical protein